MQIKRDVQSPQQALAWEACFLVPIIFAVGFLGTLAATDVLFTIILTIIFTINLIVRFFMIHKKGDWIFFLLGVIAGGGNDLMSMLKGVYDYTSITILPFLNGLLPLWNIFFWGQVFLLFRKVFNVKWFKGVPFKRDGKFLRGWVSVKLLLDICILVILRVTIYLTYNMDAWVASAIYGTLLWARLLVVKPTRDELNVIAILPYAFIFEGLMVTFGLYVYHDPVFLGMPGWLFLWWIFLVPLVLKQVFAIMEHVIATKGD